MTVHGDDFVCLSDDEGLNYIDTLLESEYTAKDMVTLGLGHSDATSLLLLNRVCSDGMDQAGQFLHVELDVRHAPPIIKESGCNGNTKTVRTRRVKLHNKLVLDG